MNPALSAAPIINSDVCENFLHFFTEKIENIRALFPPPDPFPAIPPHPIATFCHSNPVSLVDLKDIVLHMKTTSSPGDEVPCPILKEAFDIVGPSLQLIINTCLSSGSIPACLKHATVQPLLKKHNLDPKYLNNYRPISKLPFISKVLEKVVLSQLSPFPTQHTILEPFQSGFRTCHSTETALLKMTNDLLFTRRSQRRFGSTRS